MQYEIKSNIGCLVFFLGRMSSTPSFICKAIIPQQILMYVIEKQLKDLLHFKKLFLI